MNNFEFYIEPLRNLLQVDESYDDELKIYIKASSKYLVNAGCTEPVDENSEYYELFVFAMYCNISITFDTNVNSQIFIDMRDTTIESLRSDYE